MLDLVSPSPIYRNRGMPSQGSNLDPATIGKSFGAGKPKSIASKEKAPESGAFLTMRSGEATLR